MPLVSPEQFDVQIYKEEAQESKSNREIKRADASLSQGPVQPSSRGFQHCPAFGHGIFQLIEKLTLVPRLSIDMLRYLLELMYLPPETSNFVIQLVPRINSQLDLIGIVVVPGISSPPQIIIDPSHDSRPDESPTPRRQRMSSGR